MPEYFGAFFLILCSQKWSDWWKAKFYFLILDQLTLSGLHVYLIVNFKDLNYFFF